MFSIDLKRLAVVVAKFVVFVAVFWGVCAAIEWCTVDDYDQFIGLSMPEFHKDKAVNTIFVGGSYVSHGVLPSLLDNIVNKAGGGGQ